MKRTLGCFFPHRSIKDYLNNKIRILVTHQIQFLQDATKIIVLNNVNVQSLDNNIFIIIF